MVMSVHRIRVSRSRRQLAGVVAAASALLLVSSTGAAAEARSADDAVLQVNLVSDLPGVAALTDPHLVNPWGLAASATSPLWVSDNGTDFGTTYRGAASGNPVALGPVSVGVQDGSPTGQVFNDTTSFTLANGQPARFIFASENGSIDAWNGGPTAVNVATTPGAVYKGLALVRTSSGPLLLATNFAAGSVDVFDATFHRVPLGHRAFRDDTLPHGYAPFGVAVTGTTVFVSYALQDEAKHDDVAGAGHGFVDVYTATGHLQRHLIRRGELNSPWGLAIAPPGFGDVAGALLVGNFGDGRIHAYSTRTGTLRATLHRPDGSPVQIDGLWGLLPGNGTAGAPNQVWFSAGPDGEAHGLLGLLQSTDHDHH